MIDGVANQQVGAWVRATRTAQKLGVTECADRSGISRTAWYDLENDKHPPNSETQRGVAVALSRAITWHDDLLAGREPAEHKWPVSPPGGDLGREVSRLRSDVDAVKAQQDTFEVQLAAMVSQLEALAARLVSPDARES